MLRYESVTRQAVTRAWLRSWGPVAAVLIAGLALAAPMWLTPYLPAGDDSVPHIFNLFALDRQIEAGAIYPLRFPEWGFGYGYAVLSYYPPLGYYLLELWHLLGANYIVAYKIGYTLVILGAGLASYGLGAAVFNRAAGVVISLAYIYNPYFLSDIYRRAALAESLGLAVAPWVFLAIYRAGTAPGWRSYVLLSLALALLVLTHPLSTLLFAAFIVAYAVLLLIQAAPRARGRPLVVLTAGGLTAGLMTCFYWLPARLEVGGAPRRGRSSSPGFLSECPEAHQPAHTLRVDHCSVTREHGSHLFDRRSHPRGAVSHLLFVHYSAAERGAEGPVPIFRCLHVERIVVHDHFCLTTLAAFPADPLLAVPVSLVWSSGPVLGTYDWW